MAAESKKSGLVVWKWTQLPVCRHQLGIWVNLGKFIKDLTIHVKQGTKVNVKVRGESEKWGLNH